MDTVYLNGQFLPAQQASISVMDRGFLFGDGVYEVIPVYAEKLFRFDQHITRLNHSLSSIGIEPDKSTEQWRALFEELIAYNQLQNGSVYLQVTRGHYEKRDHRFPKSVTPTLFARVNAAKAVDDLPSSNGIKLASYEDIRWKRCDIKAITLLGNCMARQFAESQGADEALFINEGFALEGSASNVFMVKDGVIYTAPKSKNILGGITRDLVIEIAQQHQLPLEQSPFLYEQIVAADEVWITSSMREIQPVWQIDDTVIGGGKTGPMWFKIIEYYAEFKQKLYCGEIS